MMQAEAVSVPITLTLPVDVAVVVLVGVWVLKVVKSTRRGITEGRILGLVGVRTSVGIKGLPREVAPRRIEGKRKDSCLRLKARLGWLHRCFHSSDTRMHRSRRGKGVTGWRRGGGGGTDWVPKT